MSFATAGRRRLPGSGVSGRGDGDDADEAASSLVAPWHSDDDDDGPRPGGTFMPSCSAISAWSPGCT